MNPCRMIRNHADALMRLAPRPGLWLAFCFVAALHAAYNVVWDFKFHAAWIWFVIDPLATVYFTAMTLRLEQLRHVR